VRPLVVVQRPELIERALLRFEGCSWRANRSALERFVHPLVRAVLLRRRRLDSLVLNP
jgi:hypothetical protein